MLKHLHSAGAAGLAITLVCLPAVTAPEPRRDAAGAAPRAQAAAAPASCPGRPIGPDRVITGEFPAELAQSYVMLPFDVPAGTTAVRVKYCHDQPDLALPSVPIRHTLDLGLYEPRDPGSKVWGMDEFRGWGGSSHPDVTVSAEGFSSEEQYLATPRVDPPGKTTRAYRPGPIKPGEWAVELGLGGVAPQSLGDSDGKVAWRVEIELSADPGFADEPYRPAPYDSRPARSQPGWYAGDMHVHGEHSAYGDATMSELLEFAFRPLDQGGAGLDFITLSDYVSGSAWGEIGRYQERFPGKLIERSAEVITYRGHVNNHGSVRVVDYREGPIYERRPDGSLSQLRGRRPARDLFADIQAAGGFTQINHPTIFPSTLPPLNLFCRGCSWDYSTAETGYERADAVEIATGPAGLKTTPETGPNPFTLTAIDFYEQALAGGHHVAAVGSSDSHRAGRTGTGLTDILLQAPIGEATTVIYAEELSEPGIECGVEAGHTYVKVGGNEGPDVRFEASPAGGESRAIIGDTVEAQSARFTARVLRGNGRLLLVVKDGRLWQTAPVTSDDFSHSFSASDPGRYRLQLMRLQNPEVVTTPIWLEPGPGRVRGRDCSPLRVQGAVRRRVRRGAFRARCSASGGGLRSCTATAVIRARRAGGIRRLAIGSGSAQMPGGGRATARIRVRLNRRGRRLLRRHPRGRAFRVVFTAGDGDGAEASHSVKTRFRALPKRRLNTGVSRRTGRPRARGRARR